MLKPNSKVEAVIKWSGSKRQVAPQIGRLIPKVTKRYFEPFIGSGAMLPFRKAQVGIAGDIITELVDLWNTIKNEPEKTAIEYLQRWSRLQAEGYQVYYEVRDSFNAMRNPHDFLFLTRTCVNGLIRFNSNGDFNNSFHLSRPGINPEKLKEIIFKWHYFIQDVTFQNTDYRTTLDSVEKDDFIFLDPPYGGTKGRYTKDEFCLDSFFNELQRLNSLGANWILTFDGVAGEREYDYKLPEELYENKVLIKTGNSPFTKMMKTNIDAVYESVYLNFNPPTKLLGNFHQEVSKEPTMF
ncbi:MAG: DNA adenine methylase [Cytophagales bacterium]|nr:DNA adenine methylase [Cytophagales bacterium]